MLPCSYASIFRRGQSIVSGHVVPGMAVRFGHASKTSLLNPPKALSSAEVIRWAKCVKVQSRMA